MNWGEKMNIKEYLKENILLTDGAMGTYYSEITGNDIAYCELGNLNDKETIKNIHLKYINAGAKLIRTNTFSCNTYELGVNRKKLKEIIIAGLNIAKEAVCGKEVFIGASIGPIRDENNIDEFSDEIMDEYKYIADIMLENDINIFVFETYSSAAYLKEISKYIKSKKNDTFILTSFAFKPDRFTRDGYGLKRIFSEIENIKDIDAYGLNCGSGPSHLCEMAKLIARRDKIISVVPNAGFPEIIHERTLYPNNPKYFALKVGELKESGISIIGGCCGTNPNYIKKLRESLDLKKEENHIKNNIDGNKNLVKSKQVNSFKEKLLNNEFCYAIELSPPTDADVTKIMNGAKLCKDNNIDIVTIPDSPMSKVRADAAIMAAKIKKELDIEVMPHMCCRDKNTNAIRSAIMGSYIQDIRNVLCITGDPVSDASVSNTKSVFNLNSFRLIELADNMNEEMFNEDKLFIGGALNLNVRNKEVEYERMMKKIDKGAKFFLTQPIYDDEAIDFLKTIKSRTDVKILAGILPLVSYRNAMFLNNELPGVTIPKEYIDRFDINMSKEEGQKIGQEIAVQLCRKLKDISDGLYFIAPFYRVNMIIDIINSIKNS